MDEKTQITVLFIVTLLIGLAAVIITGEKSIFIDSFSSSLLFAEATIFAVIITPFLFLIIYAITGREKKYSVPEYLSYIPNNKLSPWEVNLIFNGETFESDENGFYATILDLYRKGYIEIKEKKSKNELLIRVINKKTDNPYEQEVIDFISMYSFKENYLDTAYFEEIVLSAQDYEINAFVARAIKEHFDSLAKKTDMEISRKYARDGRLYLMPFLIAGVILIALSIGMYKLTINGSQEYILSAVFGVVLIVQTVIALSFPSTLFGHWKDDYYKEKMEWDSFKRMLSDLSQLKKYAPSNLKEWNEWLVYGTALGVGKNVAKAMNKMDMRIEFYDSQYFLIGIINTINKHLPHSNNF